MEKLTEQQLRTLAELPYGKKYASVRVAAEEELNRRSLATKANLTKFKIFHSTMYKLKDWE